MNVFRTHNCNELRQKHIGQKVKLSGWVHRRRDHGNVLFIDLRDHYGITQLVVTHPDLTIKDHVSQLTYESVITIEGEVIARNQKNINYALDTGHIEVLLHHYTIESQAEKLPMIVNSEHNEPEDTRLKYRFLDLRRKKLHDNIMLRSHIISEIRKIMITLGFTEFQTPILTASSPEGARDFLIPSRLNPKKFYALPQAPQQFKQMLMISGFDKYFQIAPCFRDEDARADRSPGEFYQLDIEMSFVTQEDIFAVIEPMLYDIFNKFGNKKVSKTPFAKITYADAMLKYGSDKPDTRNPLQICDVTHIFRNSKFVLFKDSIKQGSVVRAIPAPHTGDKSRKFFDEIIQFAINQGATGLGYIQFTSHGTAKGPIAKFLHEEQLESLKQIANIQNGDSVFFSCGTEMAAAKLSGKVRTEIGEKLELISNDCFEFVWIIDFPFYEFNEEKQCIDFSHNPFSMPQGGLKALTDIDSPQDLLDIKAFQYDIVCNGIELSSGAIRNHKPDIMYKAFEIAGYSKEDVDNKFGGMIKALKYGAPPHGGIAPGIDRIVMLIADTINIREIIAFPMNQKGEDLLMEAPHHVTQEQLQELNIMFTPLTKHNK